MINVDRHVAEIEDEGDQDYSGHRPGLEVIPEVPIRIGEGAAQQQNINAGLQQTMCQLAIEPESIGRPRDVKDR
jgi:hypothetical protein